MDQDRTAPRVGRRRVLQGAALAAGSAFFLQGLDRALPSASAQEGVTIARAPNPGSAGVLDPAACADPNTFDTMAGICAFVVPGRDPYSKQQGVSDDRPGAVDAGAPQSLILSLNQVFVDPTTIFRLVDELERHLGVEFQQAVGNVCTPIGSPVVQPGGVPLAPVVATVLNLLAIGLRPESADGQFKAAFAELSWDDKGEVWRQFEMNIPALLLPPAWAHEVPILDSFVAIFETLGGLLAYTAGAALELVGLLTYSEGLAYDRAAGRLDGTPIGWQLAKYQTRSNGSVDGWDELKGYYQGRTTVA